MTADILLALAGLTLFLFGMLKLSIVVQTVLSTRIRKYILFSVKKPFYGILTGIFTTILFQSSSATTLLTVGLVSAGLVSFFHSLGIILGSDIGTTLTAQFVVWKFTDLSPLFIFAGGILWVFGKERLDHIGEAILYFGLIFFGLTLVSESTASFKESPAFINFFLTARNPLFGVMAGLVFTAIVQASSIPISILIILGMHGLITVDSALPVIIGANVGTTVTGLLGGTVAGIDGKRTAVAHVLFKIGGGVICILLLPLFSEIVKFLSGNIGQQIAFGHFLFNLIVVIAFVFLLRPISRLLERIIPGQSSTIPLWPEYLDSKCLPNAENALLCVQKELVREISLTKVMLTKGLRLFESYSARKKRDVTYIEMVVDNLQLEITRYLWNVSCADLSPFLSKKLFAFSSTVHDIERMGDHSTNLVELAESKFRRKSVFSEPAQAELYEIGELVLKNVNDTLSIIEMRNEEVIRQIITLNSEITSKIRNAINRHLERFYNKQCLAEAGPIYVDTLVNLRRISDHCEIIAEHMEELGEINL